MIEYLDDENDINVNEEVIRLNTYFQDVMLSKIFESIQYGWI